MIFPSSVAHHALVSAIPFVVPMLVIVAGLAFIVMRDRFGVDRRGIDGWRVELAGGELREYAGVVVANGHHWDKRYPAYEGEFAGKTDALEGLPASRPISRASACSSSGSATAAATSPSRRRRSSAMRRSRCGAATGSCPRPCSESRCRSGTAPASRSGRSGSCCDRCSRSRWARTAATGSPSPITGSSTSTRSSTRSCSISCATASSTPGRLADLRDRDERRLADRVEARRADLVERVLGRVPVGAGRRTGPEGEVDQVDGGDAAASERDVIVRDRRRGRPERRPVAAAPRAADAKQAVEPRDRSSPRAGSASSQSPTRSNSTIARISSERRRLPGGRFARSARTAGCPACRRPRTACRRGPPRRRTARSRSTGPATLVRQRPRQLEHDRDARGAVVGADESGMSLVS